MAIDRETDEQEEAGGVGTAEMSEDSEEGAEGEDKKPQRLDLSIKIDSKNACQRHVTVTVPREDIERYLDEAYSEMMGDAQVPGFRKGRAPRKLIEARFRKEVADKVKGELLMDSVGQVTEESKLAAISEPDLDPFAIELPEEGPLTFEFDIEVRPEFNLPDWKGLKIERPTRKFTDADVDAQMKELLVEHGRPELFDGPASKGDYITADISIKHEGEVVHELEEELIRLLPVLSFRDGNVLDFDKTMAGVKAGETRELKFRLTGDAPNEELRGKQVTAEFKVIDVRKLELPAMTPRFLDEIGGFESEEALRTAVRNTLDRQLEYAQMRRVRKQITAALTESANWELPQEMLRRQANRELQRAVLEMRRNNFTDAQIRAHENELRQNSLAETARALKEHFILERIAEQEKLDATDSDFDDEIELIAYQSGETARRVRARLEKSGNIDAVRNQIIERKALRLIMDAAKYADVPYELERPHAEALERAAGGGESESDIPEAKPEHEEEEDEE
jgi:trigger factor